MSESLEFPFVLLVSLAWSLGFSLQRHKFAKKSVKRRRRTRLCAWRSYLLWEPAASTMAL